MDPDAHGFFEVKKKHVCPPCSFGWTRFLAGSKIEAMKPLVAHQKTAALTRVEVVVIILVLALLVALLVPALIAARKKATKISCANNLAQVGLAFRIWEGGHTNLYPMSVSKSFGGTLEFVVMDPTFTHLP